MLRIDSVARSAFLVLIVYAVFHSELVRADIEGLGSDGWHTWRVDAVASAPGMCCFSWRNGTVTGKRCNLDGRNSGFSRSDESASSDGAVRIFVLMKADEVTRIRTLSTSCPVSANSKITDLGPIPADDSVDWLEQFISVGERPGSDAIAAIAVHEGQKARSVLLDAAKSGNDKNEREEAIFWMALVRIDETAADLRNFIFDDSDAGIREQAAFAYSQSRAADISSVLSRQGKIDEDPDVRSQAWFWLAQTEAPESEAEIGYALRNDRDEDVREEAVFALSQLPEDRAVKALVTVLEDRRLGMDIREQALFWLAQTESDEAFEYFDRLFGNN